MPLVSDKYQLQGERVHVVYKYTLVMLYYYPVLAAPQKDWTLRVHINHAMAARHHATQTHGARVLSRLVGQISDVGSTRRTFAALFETAEEISNSNMNPATKQHSREGKQGTLVYGFCDWTQLYGVW